MTPSTIGSRFQSILILWLAQLKDAPVAQRLRSHSESILLIGTRTLRSSFRRKALHLIRNASGAGCMSQYSGSIEGTNRPRCVDRCPKFEHNAVLARRAERLVRLSCHYRAPPSRGFPLSGTSVAYCRLRMMIGRPSIGIYPGLVNDGHESTVC